jgi:hypothetical protein
LLNSLGHFSVAHAPALLALWVAWHKILDCKALAARLLIASHNAGAGFRSPIIQPFFVSLLALHKRIKLRQGQMPEILLWQGKVKPTKGPQF